MKRFYSINELITEYKYDTNGHFFDKEGMKQRGQRLLDLINLEDGRAIVTFSELDQYGLDTKRIWRGIIYTPGTKHTCPTCSQRDQQGTLNWFGWEIHEQENQGRFDSKRELDKAIKEYVKGLSN